MKKLLLGAGVTSAAIIFGVATASSVGDLNVFTANTTAVAADVNKNFEDIKTAVNDNDSRLTNLAQQVTSLGGTVGCPTGMIDFGSFCIDGVEGVADAAGTAGCNTDGSGCGDLTATIAADSASASGSISWFQAAVACSNAGKRLPTNQEWSVAAALAGTKGVTGMANDPREWVADWSNSAGDTNANAAPITVNHGRGIAQPGNGANPTPADPVPAAMYRGFGSRSNTVALNATPYFTDNTLGFRCATTK